MLYLLMLFCCLLVNPLQAESLGGVHFNLPRQEKGWVRAQRLERGHRKFHKTLYVKEGTTLEKGTPDELVFVIVDNSLPFPDAGIDKDFLRTATELMFPKQSVKGKFIEHDKKTLLFEWILSEKGQKFYGLGRAFFTRQGFTVLSYQAKKESLLSKNHSLWIKTLNQAKLIY